MNRAKKQEHRGSGLPGAESSEIIGGVTPGSTRRPPGSSRTGAGRLGRALADSDKKPASRAKSKPTAVEAIERWENEGGRVPRSASVRGPAPKHAAKRSRPSPNMSSFPALLPSNRSPQRGAQARVKGSKIKQAGLESRLLGHVSGSGKRNQARRDSKH